MIRHCVAFVLTLIIDGSPASGREVAVPLAVERILSQQSGRLDYLAAKLALDRIVDPSLDDLTASRQVDELVAVTRRLTPPGASDQVKLAVIRQVIYAPGPWNGGRAFRYNLSDPLGRNVKTKLLATYLNSRRGNCVSMPVLFLAIADRLGLNVALSAAPLHILVRYTGPTGKVTNLEATSGGNLTRDIWYRKNLPMTDRAIESGAYLRTLSRRESVALMATTVTDYLFAEHRYDDAIAVANVILKYAPRDAYTMVRRGSAAGEIIRTEFESKYANPASMHGAALQRYRRMVEINDASFRQAAALGWNAGEDTGDVGVNLSAKSLSFRS